MVTLVSCDFLQIGRDDVTHREKNIEDRKHLFQALEEKERRV